MTDIVERLRAFNTAGWPLVEEAADEVERLRAKIKRWETQSIAQYAEIKRLRAALQEIMRFGGAEDTLSNIARRALEPKP